MPYEKLIQSIQNWIRRSKMIDKCNIFANAILLTPVANYSLSHCMAAFTFFQQGIFQRIPGIAFIK